MLENLESLKRFVAVAESGSVRRAADQIGLTQPALTRSIRLLEEQVGAPLFERRSRGVHLTSLGGRVLIHARHLLRESHLAEIEIRALREGERGTIRVAAAPVWMHTILPYCIARMHARHPALSVTLEPMDYTTASPRLQNGELDAFFGGFQRIEGLPSFLIRRALMAAELTVIGRDTHPLLSKGVASARDLLSWPWLSYQSDLAYLDTVRDAIQEETGTRIHAAIQCESMITVLELLREGDFLALLPSSSLTSSHGTGLTIIPTNLKPIAFQSGPIHRRSLQSNQAFRTLLSLAEERIDALGLRAR
ncbi:LysR family transcriptional regulator [Aliiruegeria sabulilitoris]|uniref:LysR family transcriptional regulator n=1 Tax=Aliiruegeria sabulilitoris TaxID=1510458 RepID=UPI00082E35A3|nr:LysR family transcriptional regulator [Aliiruegeria sabulilitoris]NDR58006.1 LysR family transcriptional regulator [Pseudoruegeria sp. M32A2M]